MDQPTRQRDDKAGKRIYITEKERNGRTWKRMDNQPGVEDDSYVGAKEGVREGNIVDHI